MNEEFSSENSEAYEKMNTAYSLTNDELFGVLENLNAEKVIAQGV